MRIRFSIWEVKWSLGDLMSGSTCASLVTSSRQIYYVEICIVNESWWFIHLIWLSPCLNANWQVRDRAVTGVHSVGSTSPRWLVLQMALWRSQWALSARLEIYRWQGLASALAKLCGGGLSGQPPVAEAQKLPSAQTSLSSLGKITGCRFWSLRWASQHSGARPLPEKLQETRIRPGPPAQFPGLKF